MAPLPLHAPLMLATAARSRAAVLSEVSPSAAVEAGALSWLISMVASIALHRSRKARFTCGARHSLSGPLGVAHRWCKTGQEARERPACLL